MQHASDGRSQFCRRDWGRASRRMMGGPTDEWVFMRPVRQEVVMAQARGSPSLLTALFLFSDPLVCRAIFCFTAPPPFRWWQHFDLQKTTPCRLLVHTHWVDPVRPRSQEWASPGHRGRVVQTEPTGANGRVLYGTTGKGSV